jgi:hypothetical protein
MKTILCLLAAGVLGVAGFNIFLRHAAATDASPTPAPTATAAASPLTAAMMASHSPAEPTVESPARVADTREAAPPDAVTTALATAVETLTSPQSAFAQKQALWDELRTSGRLGTVVASLEKLAAENPADAQVQTALGEGLIQKLRAVTENGGDTSEIPILALQADRSFSRALAVDATNWEAQYMKAASLAHWPAELNKRGEVITRLSDLVKQQENTPPRPEFAQTYVLLAQQYKAAGQNDEAAQMLQRGAMRFPGIAVNR